MALRQAAGPFIKNKFNKSDVLIHGKTNSIIYIVNNIVDAVNKILDNDNKVIM